MATAKKVETVKKLADLVGKAHALVFVDYKGLKHKQLEELRKSLKKVDAKFSVTKNRLLLRALGDMGKAVEPQLNQTRATLFALGDEASAVKELTKFLKTAGVGRALGGMMGDIAMSEADVARLASVPSREILIGKVAMGLKSPLYGMHNALSWNIYKLIWVLNGVKGAKSN